MNELANENNELQQYIQNHLPPEQPELPEEGPEPNEESEGGHHQGMSFQIEIVLSHILGRSSFGVTEILTINHNPNRR